MESPRPNILESMVPIHPGNVNSIEGKEIFPKEAGGDALDGGGT